MLLWRGLEVSRTLAQSIYDAANHKRWLVASILWLLEK